METSVIDTISALVQTVDTLQGRVSALEVALFGAVATASNDEPEPIKKLGRKKITTGKKTAVKVSANAAKATTGRKGRKPDVTTGPGYTIKIVNPATKEINWYCGPFYRGDVADADNYTTRRSEATFFAEARANVARSIRRQIEAQTPDAKVLLKATDNTPAE